MKKQYMAKTVNTSQRGVALLFALGILAVLMVLGLAFVSNALIAQKISVNNSNRSQAEVLAQSAINRILASTKFYSEDVLFDSFGGRLLGTTLVSKAKDYNQFNPNTAAFASDGISQWGDLANIDKIYGGSYNTKGFAAGAVPEWNLVFDHNGRIVGRYAYAVLPLYMWPRIDFATVHSTLADPEGVTPTQMGCNVELFDGVGSENWYTQFGLNTVTLNQKWRSYSQIFARQNVTDVTKQQLIRSIYGVNYPPMIEAYQATDNKGVINDYHRFNLDRTDWSTMTVGDLLGDNPELYWTAATPRDIQTTTETKRLPFLARIGNDKGTFVGVSGLTARRKQIAANLIDYCVNNNAVGPTSDAAQPWTLASVLTYTGNAQTDYIYEVGYEFNIIKDKTSAYADSGFHITPATAGETDNVEYSLGILPVVKLVKMYKTTPNDYNFACALDKVSIEAKITKCTVEVVYKDDALPVANELTATLQFTDVASSNVAINSGDKNNVSPTGEVVISGAPDAFGFKTQVPDRNFGAGGLRTDKTTVEVETKTKIATLARVKAQCAVATSVVSAKLISIEEVEVDKVSLTPGNMLLLNGDKSRGVDFVNGPLSPLAATNATQVAANTGNLDRNFKFALGSAKGIDPRQNLNPDDWDCSTNVKTTATLGSDDRLVFAEVMDLPGSSTSVNGCNTNPGANPQNPSDVDFDRETVTSPGYVSDNQMISTAKFPDFPTATDFSNPGSNLHTMISPSELGRIHRGAKWETINLSNAAGSFNDTIAMDVSAVTTTYLNSAGTAYKDGDGGILDMIKSIDYSLYTGTNINKRYYTYGKIDLNCADGTGSSADKTRPGDYVYANWLARVVKQKNYILALVEDLNNQNNPKLKTRSEVLVNTGSDGFFNAWATFAPQNKNEMDSFAGNLINLTEANLVPMVFRAIVKAQSIQDLGPNDGTPADITKMINGTPTSVTVTKGKFDKDGDDITGEVSYLVTFVRHPVTNQFFVVDKVQITE